MNRAIIRSTLFNLLFYSWTAFCCFLFIPFYILPRPAYLGFVRFWLHGVHALEAIILNLRYEVRGVENLPAQGSYIVAAKHQSPYETMKLHLLFKDPAIILKKELLSIPFWGQYLKKADVIAIDRSTPDQAIQSIQDGARRVQAQNRPIIIFPQGTRVWPDEAASNKPYKVGVARIQEATNLPVVPLALNTGMFWPRKGWLKSPGTVVFEFLPPILPGLERSALLQKLTTVTEDASNKLMNEAIAAQKKTNFVLTTIVTSVILFILYTALWFGSAKALEYLYINTITNNASITRTYVSPVTITGFPGPMVLTSEREIFHWGQGTADIKNVKITSWPMPLPLFYIDVEAAQTDIDDPALNGPLSLNNTKLRLSYFKNLTVHESSALLDNNPLNFKGKISFENPPKVNLLLKIGDTGSFIEELKQRKFLNDNSAIWVKAGLEMYRKDGLVQLPIQQKDGTIYVGLIAIMKMHVKIESPRRQTIRPEPAAP